MHSKESKAGIEQIHGIPAHWPLRYPAHTHPSEFQYFAIELVSLRYSVLLLYGIPHGGGS